jgi:hypothetical protein
METKNEINEKRRIIFENNEFVCDHTQIINILEKYKCKYTTNSNGIFINLITIPDNIIEEIYPFFINNTIEIYDDYNINHTEIKQTDMQKINDRNIETYDIPLDIFPLDEQEIIKYSNNYFL